MWNKYATNSLLWIFPIPESPSVILTFLPVSWHTSPSLEKQYITLELYYEVQYNSSSLGTHLSKSVRTKIQYNLSIKSFKFMDPLLYFKRWIGQILIFNLNLSWSSRFCFNRENGALTLHCNVKRGRNCHRKNHFVSLTWLDWIFQ